MLNKAIMKKVEDSKKHVMYNVFYQWVALLFNIVIIFIFSNLIANIYYNKVSTKSILISLGLIAVSLALRYLFIKLSVKMSYISTKAVKLSLREMIYKKLISLGGSYKEKVPSSEVVNLTVEGVEQLETYFGLYLPQFFYSMLAPLTLFVFLSFISFKSALLLLLMVPLIPIIIALIQTFAKKLLSKYWGQYNNLADIFLENLEGLTTLKIYQTDEYKNIEMNKQAEKFRKITMRVLSMQLNSIIVMDLVAFGGSAVGVILAATQLRSGVVSLAGAILIILISAEFFIPMRLLGSYFHIAMNGMAAAEKIVNLLELDSDKNEDGVSFPENADISVKNLTFSYTPDRKILNDISFELKDKSFTAIVGESGSGKSTIATLLMAKYKHFEGSIDVAGTSILDINEDDIYRKVAYIGFDNYIFSGTIRENLAMARENLSDDDLLAVLKRVNLYDFIRSERGLDTELTEGGKNLSGGQRQRLSLARAILHDADIYIFDEATSNIDVESENMIMEEIVAISKEKMVVLITHRLLNATYADNILMLEGGKIVESGIHEKLLDNKASYHKLWTTQHELEMYKVGA